MSRKYHDGIIDNRTGKNRYLDREDLLDILLRSLRDPKVLDEYESEQLTIHYETITVWGDEIYPASWDGPAEYAEIDNYEFDYEPDYDEISEYLADRLQDEEEIVNLITEIDDDLVIDWEDKFIVSLSLLYEEDIVDKFYENAEEDAQEDYNQRCEDAKADAEEARYEAMMESRYDY